MKVLFHGWEFPPQGGGVGAYMRNMADALGESGHTAVVVTGRAERLPEVETASFGRVYRVYDRHEAGSQRVTDLVLSIARQEEVDCIEGADHLGECAPLLRRRDRPPIMIKYHACQVVRPLLRSHVLYPWQRVTMRLALWRQYRQIANERFCMQHADFSCVPTQRLLVEARKQGLRLPDRVAVIPNPFVIGQGPGTAAAVAQEPTILFAGRIDIGKGIQYLPGILEGVARDLPSVCLEIAGDDSYARGLGSLQAWLTRQFGGLIGKVRFLGRLGRKDMDGALHRAWVVVVPSRWDNFPTVVLEAMAQGKAIVASPHGGMPEMLEGTGCPVADPATPAFTHATRSLLQDRARRLAAGESGRQRLLSAYVPSILVPRYVQFIGACLRQHGEYLNPN
jgi:glycosyltransferase involved in cell wall biosynthesis